MQGIFQELLIIENKVKQIQASCAAEQEKLKTRVDSAKTRIEQEIFDNADAESRSIKSLKSNEALDTVTKVFARTQDLIAQMEKNFEQTRGTIEDEIFSRVTAS